MNKKREREIIDALWGFSNTAISQEQLDRIAPDFHERRFAMCNLHKLNIRIRQPYRSLDFAEIANHDFRKRKEMERELTINRKQERQFKYSTR